MNTITGLSESEVATRRQSGKGNNIKLDTSRTYLDIVRANLFSFFNTILFTIGFLLIAMGRVNDALTSVGIGLVNALISTIQEARAKRQLDQISLLTRPEVAVIRESNEKIIDPSELVCGDIVRVRSGDQIVVDGIVLEDENADDLQAPRKKIEVDESLLTGESDLIRKAAGDTLLSGSYCVTGTALYEVTKVGADSFANRVTATAREFQITKTPLQINVELIVRILMLVAALMGIVLFVAWVVEGGSLLRIVQIAAVITGQIPYGLFFMIVLAYAVGAVKVSRQGALIQQTNAIESLSNVNVLCMDKTGTLTANRINYYDVYPVGIEKSQLEKMLSDFARSASSTNRTSEAIIEGLDGQAHHAVDEVAFASARKWSALAFDDDEMHGVYVLGAIEMLQLYLPADALAAGSDLAKQAQAWSDEGLRVLLFAHSQETTTLHDPAGQPALPQLTPLGLLCLSDELRPQAKETLNEFNRAGISLKIISGDNPHTVAALAKQAGLPHDAQLISGPELAQMDDAQFEQSAEEVTIFGRITPEQKERLVDSLLKRGHYVAMMGDGVNDVLSLKKARVGIAMQSGSSATRNVADMVLLNDSFAALPFAFIEGRRIINSMRSILSLFLARVFTSAALIVAITMVGLGFPFEPAQVALTTFTVGVPAFFLSLWERPGTSKSKLFQPVLHFVLPAAILTMIFGLAIFTMMHNRVTVGLTSYDMPPQLLQRFEAYTGQTVSAGTDSVDVMADIAAQTALSIFISYTAFLLVIFVKPPIPFFVGGAPLSDDKRPTWLAIGLILLFLIILFIEPLSNYFGLIRFGWPLYLMLGVVAMVWALLLRTIWRASWFERFLLIENI